MRWGPSPGLAVLLSEDPQQEVGVLVRLEGGGDDDVLPWGQLELAAHLPRVGEDLRETQVLVLDEEVLFQVDILEVLKLYVPCKWVQGPRGEGRERGTPTVRPSWARLGGRCLAGNPSVVVSFPDSHPGRKVAGTLTQRPPEPFTEFHPWPIYTQPGMGWVSARHQAARLQYLLWDLGREERGGSDSQDG